MSPNRNEVDLSQGVLYVVAGPIGNLEDITLRAIDVLKAVDAIACEDTRVTRTLTTRLGISSKLFSLHKFNEAKNSEKALVWLREGKSVALVSDAGSPGVSDPGHRLVSLCFDAGIRVVPIPGPSSITAALSVCGMDCSTFVFLGYVPKKAGERGLFMESLKFAKMTAVFFETPHRIVSTLEECALVLGEREIVLARELTKIHEEILRGTAGALHRDFASRPAVKGEFVIVVGAGSEEGEIDAGAAIKILIEEGFSGKNLANEANKRFGINKKRAYELFLSLR